jgi:lipopolysaccharide/colanic/teichoic acid biosynthesis glycosyltransferase
VQLIEDLQNYLVRVPVKSKHKQGVQLLEQSLAEIARLYEVADAAFSLVGDREPDPEKLDALQKIVARYFSDHN